MAIRMGCVVCGRAVAVPMPPAAATGQFKDLLNKVKQLTHQADSPQLDTNLPASDIAAGLKEALAQGTTDAINSRGRNGGFWKNPKVRIALTGEREQAGKLARELGKGTEVDAFELSMNRAAEKAVPQVAQVFGDAIRKMTLSDARGILTGGDHAATDYFRGVAGDALTARIHRIVARATDSAGVTQKYKSFTSASSGSALGSMLGKSGGGMSDKGGNLLDLGDYATKETINGLFTEIGAQGDSPFVPTRVHVPTIC